MSINILYLFYSNLFWRLPYMRIQFFPGSTLFAMSFANKVVVKKKIKKKISKSIGIISRIRHFVWLSSLHHNYRSLIQLYSLSGLIAGGNAAKIHKPKILTFQKRALCLIYFGDCKSVAIPFFISSRLLLWMRSTLRPWL